MANQKERLKAVLGWVLVLLNFAAIFGVASSEEFRGRDLLLILLLLPPAIFISVVLHELGHLVAGLLVGFRFQLMNLGPVSVIADHHRLNIRLSHNPSLGLVGFAPEDTHDLRRRLRIYYLSGMIAGVISSVVFLIIFFILFDIGRGVTTTGVVIQEPLLSILTVLSFWLMLGSFMLGFIVPMLPTKVNQIPSDGMQIDSLSKMDEPQFKRYAAQVVLLTTSCRPREWDSHLLTSVNADSENPFDHAFATLLTYIKCLDSADIAQAEAHVNQMLELGQQLDGTAQAPFFIEAAYFEARWHQNLALAKDYLNQVDTNGFKNVMHRTTAAVLLAEGKSEEANHYIDNAIKSLRRAPFTGLVEFEIERLNEMRVTTINAN